MIFRIVLLFILPLSLLGQKPYRGAEYRTKEAFTYGRFEVRMKSAQLSGMLSSFFTYHEISSLNDWNEIDIEILGRYGDQVQFNTITPGQTNHVFSYTVPFNPHSDFHIYAIEWTPNYVAWSVDSVEVYRQTGNHINSLYRSQKLMMNIWPPASEDWVGPLNPDKLPVYAFYDWVKVYQYTPGQNKDFTLLWEDQFNTYDQSRWQKATHTWDGNNSQFIKENAVLKDGYLILCLTKTTPVGYQGGMIPDQDVTPPYVARAWFLDDQIVVTFSEKVNRQQAENKANYILPGLTVNRAILKDDLRTVVLDVSTRDENQSYNIICTNITDLSSSANKIKIQSEPVLNGIVIPALINLGSEESVEAYLADQTFTTDQPYGHEGGSFVQHGSTTDFGNTDQDVLFQSELRGLDFYRIRVANGHYKLKFYFAETEFKASGQRRFNLFVEGQKVIEDLDIFDRVGANNALQMMVDDVEVQDEQLDVYFEALSGEAVCSAIEIEHSLTGMQDKSFKNRNPRHFGLRIFPNPANPQFNLEYQLPERGNVQIIFADVNGRLIKEINAGLKGKGVHRLRLNAERWSSGTYFCLLRQEGQTIYSKKFVLIK